CERLSRESVRTAELRGRVGAVTRCPFSRNTKSPVARSKRAGLFLPAYRIKRSARSRREPHYAVGVVRALQCACKPQQMQVRERLAHGERQLMNIELAFEHERHDIRGAVRLVRT